jgi:hypothetical protein
MKKDFQKQISLRTRVLLVKIVHFLKSNPLFLLVVLMLFLGSAYLSRRVVVNYRELQSSLSFCLQNNKELMFESADENGSHEELGNTSTPVTYKIYTAGGSVYATNRTYRNSKFGYTIKIPEDYILIESEFDLGRSVAGNSLSFSPEGEPFVVQLDAPLELSVHDCWGGKDKLSLDELVESVAPILAEAWSIEGSMYVDEVVKMEVYDHSSVNARRFYMNQIRTGIAARNGKQEVVELGPLYAFDIRESTDDCLLILHPSFHSRYFQGDMTLNAEMLEVLKGLAESLVIEK